MSNNRILHMNKLLKQQVIECLLGDEPMFNSEIMEKTGCTQWQVTCIRKELVDSGIVLRQKKQAVRKTQFVLHGKTEEKANKSDAVKEARRIHRKLVNLEFKRELQALYSDPLDIRFSYID